MNHQAAPYFVLRDEKGVAKAILPREDALKVVATDNGRWEDAVEAGANGERLSFRIIQVTVDGRFGLGLKGQPGYTILMWKGDTLRPLDIEI